MEEKILQLTLEEKAFLVSGKTFWTLRSVAGYDGITMTDGPHGLRRMVNIEDLDLGASEEAICFPTAVATANSFNPDLIFEMGEFLAEEMLAMDVQVLLGPGVNIKRSPLCGRNFEYFSEDPYHAGKMATALIRGIQSKGVGTSLKHYVANNQERRRMTVDAVVDERTLREIYLAAFEEPVKVGKPWTIMAAYNRINGRYACHNPYLLKTVLRDQWEYQGVVLSDWGAVDDLNDAIRSGLDLEMPTSGRVGPQTVIKAVKKGRLDIEDLDRSILRIADLQMKGNRSKQESGYDKMTHHTKAREIASECIVLLENRGSVLPISTSNICLIGEFGVRPRIQGGGSSKINPFQVDTIRDQFASRDISISYHQGYCIDQDSSDPALEKEALEASRKADTTVVLVGLPDRYETEGVDRLHLNMPPNQLKLVDLLVENANQLIVVVTAGSVVKIPFTNQVDGLLFTGLLGEAGAGALVDVLMGQINPSGKLSESFIRSEEDDPSFGNFPGQEEVIYEEGIFIGYRHHDAQQTDLLYPFGYGLSYTSFEFVSIILDADEILDHEHLLVTVTVKNSGEREGKEVVQLYVGEQFPLVPRPPKELKRFAKIHLQPGETTDLQFSLDKRCFAYYNTDLGDWHVHTGTFDILVGNSCKNIFLSQTVHVRSSHPLDTAPQSIVYNDAIKVPITKKIHRNTHLELLKTHPIGKSLHQRVIEAAIPDYDEDSDISIMDKESLSTTIESLPLRALVSMSQGEVFSPRSLKILIFILNITRPSTPIGWLLNLVSRHKSSK